MNIEIITIGDEILIGQIVDTNSAWMAPKLNEQGFQVVQITSVKDDKQQIMQAFDLAFTRADIVLVTGGIGPTKDDITKLTLCEYFHTKPVYSQEVYDNIISVLSDRMRKINRLTETQAWVPENCTVINNRRGTAPITWFEKKGKILVSMPGVPYEMRGAMEQEIIPRLIKQFPQRPTIIHRTFLIRHYTESALAEKLEEWENQLPDFIKLAYLPQWGIIRLRLTGTHLSHQLLETTLQQHIEKLKQILQPEDIFSELDTCIEQVIGEKLQAKGWTLATAESCTGGTIAQHITSIPGASSYFKGGVIAYANEIKEQLLHVSPHTLAQWGAVSEATVLEMAEGAKKILQTDCAIATSGIAGPGGGTPQKPVGTICIGISTPNGNTTTTLHLKGERESNILRTVNNGLLLLLEKLA